MDGIKYMIIMEINKSKEYVSPSLEILDIVSEDVLCSTSGFNVEIDDWDDSGLDYGGSV